jgi:hypothetical protein
VVKEKVFTLWKQFPIVHNLLMSHRVYPAFDNEQVKTGGGSKGQRNQQAFIKQPAGCDVGYKKPQNMRLDKIFPAEKDSPPQDKYDYFQRGLFLQTRHLKKEDTYKGIKSVFDSCLQYPKAIKVNSRIDQ